jgi:hypothetical protein
MNQHSTSEGLDPPKEPGLKGERRSFATEELDEATVERIAKTRMHARHQHLDELLKDG